MNKIKLRKIAKEIRNKQDIFYCSKNICEYILSSDFFAKADNIMLYAPIGNEISLYEIIDAANANSKSFYFPSVCGDEILPVLFLPDKGFKKGEFGIFEPVGNVSDDFNNIDLIFIPALAADYNGYRLGYGKGFYDRFLPKLKKTCTKIIPIYSPLVFHSIPTESHDVRADYLLTENGLIKCVS